MTSRPQTALPDIDILVSADLWRGAPSAEAIVRRAVLEASTRASCPAGAEIAVMLTNDASMRALNRDWRGLDKPTNVLSFPAPSSMARSDAPQMLGDIAIAFETVQREAEAEGKTFHDHLSHLAVHGFLHLIGYDHESAQEAAAMEQREREILASLGIADPYAGLDGAD